MKRFLVVVDQTPECMKALRFAAQRAKNAGRGVAMLYVLEPGDFQHWAMVADAMRADAIAAAEERLTALAEEVKALTGETPVYAIREGVKRDQVLAHIRETPEISLLVLGAGTEGEGPGPLVNSLAGQMAGRMPVPVTVVPGSMTFEEIDAVC